MADPVLGSLQPEPAGDLLWRPAHRKVAIDMIPQRAQALGLRASSTALERHPVRRGRLKPAFSQLLRLSSHRLPRGDDP